MSTQKKVESRERSLATTPGMIEDYNSVLSCCDCMNTTYPIIGKQQSQKDDKITLAFTSAPWWRSTSVRLR